MLEMFFGSKLEQAERAYTKHQRKHDECISKARQAQGNNNYELSDYFMTQAKNHASMMNHYAKVIERTQVDDSPIITED